MTLGAYKELYHGWTIVVSVEAWPFAIPPIERFVPTVALVRPEKLQQRFLDVGRGAAFMRRADALQHGLTIARKFVDADLER